MVRSQVATTFSEPLSSGLSVADVVENALPSVARIVTGSGTGTGFVINESGLLVTNKHVVDGYASVRVEMATGSEYRGSVTRTHPTLDLAYIDVDSGQSFTPIAVGDSDDVRVGAEVIAIGFPLGSTLGDEPTVSRGIISAKRDGRLQTDASVNPGNSGGPLLDMFGQAVGVVVSRVEESSSGRPIMGIGFAIPINEVKAEQGERVSPEGRVLPTPSPTPFPAIGPTPDVEATKRAIDAIDAHRRASDQATQTAAEAQATAEHYAASLEATRVAGLPTPTATATPTAAPTATLTPTPEPLPTATPVPTPTPTPTPHPRTHCQEWEAIVLEWIRDGNYYGHHYSLGDPERIPNHPQLSADEARLHCLTTFPIGILYPIYPGYIYLGNIQSIRVGYESGDLLPGAYEYRREGDKRVESESCAIILNYGSSESSIVELPYGETFTFEFFSYHGRVRFDGYSDGRSGCDGRLYRIGN